MWMAGPSSWDTFSPCFLPVLIGALKSKLYSFTSLLLQRQLPSQHILFASLFHLTSHYRMAFAYSDISTSHLQSRLGRDAIRFHLPVNIRRMRSNRVYGLWTSRRACLGGRFLLPAYYCRVKLPYLWIGPFPWICPLLFLLSMV